MQTSIFLAQIMGPFCLVSGLSMIIKRKMLVSIFHELFNNRALLYILGVLVFLMGLLIVLNHNIWGGVWPTLITIIGWIILIEGASYMFMSKRMIKKYMKAMDDKGAYYFIAFTYLFLGLYFLYFCFLS